MLDSQNFVNLYKMNLKYGVLGGGSWGTAIVKMLCENNDSINWYVRSDEDVSFLKKKAKIQNIYVQSISKNKKLNISSSITKISEESDLIIIAIPSPFVDTELKKLNIYFLKKLFSQHLRRCSNFSFDSKRTLK